LITLVVDGVYELRDERAGEGEGEEYVEEGGEVEGGELEGGEMGEGEEEGGEMGEGELGGESGVAVVSTLVDFRLSEGAGESLGG
jgi:hypothetical protein